MNIATSLKNQVDQAKPNLMFTIDLIYNFCRIVLQPLFRFAGLADWHSGGIKFYRQLKSTCQNANN